MWLQFAKARWQQPVKNDIGIFEPLRQPGQFIAERQPAGAPPITLMFSSMITSSPVVAAVWEKCSEFFPQSNVKPKYTIDFNNIKCYINLIKEGDAVPTPLVPDWILNLEDEDLTFIKRFLLASGSLKEMAKQYDVTYPTVRLRLDKLIQKIQISEDASSELYVSLIKRLAVNDKLDLDTAKILITEYKKLKEDE